MFVRGYGLPPGPRMSVGLQKGGIAQRKNGKRPLAGEARGGGNPFSRCRVTIAPQSERPSHVREVTRRYILPAILEYVKAAPHDGG